LRLARRVRHRCALSRLAAQASPARADEVADSTTAGVGFEGLQHQGLPKMKCHHPTKTETLLKASIQLECDRRYIQKLERDNDRLRRELGKMRLLEDLRRDIRRARGVAFEVPALCKWRAD
jgi:hypothetical protein